MRKEKRKVHWERKDSYVDSEGNYHAHESSRWSDTEVEIDQYGKVIDKNLNKKWKDSWESPISSKDSDFEKARKLIF